MAAFPYGMNLRAGAVTLALWLTCGTLSSMTTSSNPYRSFRYAAQVIQHAVWLYQR